MVVFDATMLLLAFRLDKVNPPIDPTSGLPVEYVRERIDELIKVLDKAKVKIIIPAPALSEVLVRAGEDTQTLINIIQKRAVFRVEPFDALSAIEVAMMTRHAIEGGDKKGGMNCSWAKIKYDRQIVAIAKVHGATAIYSEDGDIHSYGEEAQMRVIRVADLPIPKGADQGVLELKENPDITEQEQDIDTSEESKTEEVIETAE